ncbi:MAG TPA: sugar ABC transporter permease [Rhodothermales bacterium]|nr:sugar ABC transporter permease [Rhodothermales bacterium]
MPAEAPYTDTASLDTLAGSMATGATQPPATKPKPKSPARKLKLGDRTGYLFVAPYILHLLLFFGYPLLFAVVLVFNRWDIVTPMEFVGLKNFGRLIQDDLFFRAILNTGLFLVIHIPLQIIVALFFAELLNGKLKGRTFFRTIYFLPVVVSGVVITILFQQLFAFDTGFINNVLAAMGGKRVPWLVSPHWAMPSIALMATWKNVGLYVILFLAGLQNIPASLYEVADIEGANAWRKWWHITLPMLNPTVVTVVLLSTIGGFSLFIEPYVLTGGGPLNSTLSGLLYIYNQAFYFNHMGYAAALGLCFALIILGVVVLQRRFVETEVY